MKIIKISVILLLTIIALVCILFGYKDIPMDELKAKYSNEESQFIAMDGMDVHYNDVGNPLDSLPIVLIHGTGSSLHTFDVWTEELKGNRRIIRMDIPAFGLTGTMPERDYSIKNYVTFIQHFLDKIGVQKCILAGNSLGGQIAWNFTAEYPNRVQSLILIDAAGYPIDSKSIPIAFLFARLPVVNKMLSFITPKFMARSSVENVYADKSKVTDELANRYFELTLRAGNRQALVDRLTGNEDFSTLSKIKNIKQPTLILWGENDLLIPVSNAYNFQKDLSNDTLVIMKNVGHVPMEESPKESLAILKNFIGMD